ncbi:MAG: diaminobutyrate acetyltransferase [Pseudomonadota bacterium]|nr:diaminobutyrate acetyltransferase [Pseudomonadota bacterium]
MEYDSQSVISFRLPKIEDGIAIYKLIKQSPPLDLNSSYLYFLQATHFADTCLLAEKDGEIVGFISGYFRPDGNDSLFIWQIAVSEKARGQGLAKRLVYQLIRNQANRPIVLEVCCTISPSNTVSQNLFKSFAEQHGLIIEKEPFLESRHFGSDSADSHDAEDLYRIRAAYNDNLVNTLF